MNRNKELKVHSLQLTGRSLCSIRSNRKWCKRRGSSLQCQNCFFVYTISDCNLKNFLQIYFCEMIEIHAGIAAIELCFQSFIPSISSFVFSSSYVYQTMHPTQEVQPFPLYFVRHVCWHSLYPALSNANQEKHHNRIFL